MGIAGAGSNLGLIRGLSLIPSLGLILFVGGDRVVFPRGLGVLDMGGERESLGLKPEIPDVLLIIR